MKEQRKLLKKNIKTYKNEKERKSWKRNNHKHYNRKLKDNLKNNNNIITKSRYHKNKNIRTLCSIIMHNHIHNNKHNNIHDNDG